MNKTKVSVITILDNNNIGTYLQAFALGHVLSQRDYQVEFVDYQRPSQTNASIAHKIWNNNKGNIAKAFATVSYRLLIDSLAKRRGKSFLKQKMHLTRLYKSFKQLKVSPPLADIYITGSDQVWNCVHNNGFDPSFFLGYVDKEKPKYSYAASIGMNKLPEIYKKEMLAYLKQYRCISTREYLGQKLLLKEGISNTSTVIDPTLLVPKNEWTKFASDDSFKKTEPYLLIYSVESHKKKAIEMAALSIAKQRGLKIYTVTPGWFREGFRCNRSFYFATPQRFLKLFQDADFAIVSSFHGTAFAVNFNIQFLSITPNRFNSRISSLLGLLKLENKIIQNADFALEESTKEINYDPINTELTKQRAFSNTFIDNIQSK